MTNASRLEMAAAAGLWLFSALLGLAVIAAIIQDLLPLLFVALGLSSGSYAVAYNLLALLLGILWIGLVVGGGEYHRTRIGRPRSWQLFGLTLGIEVAILLIAAVL